MIENRKQVQWRVEAAMKELQHAIVLVDDRESMDYKRLSAAILALNMILEERLYFDARDE